MRLNLKELGMAQHRILQWQYPTKHTFGYIVYILTCHHMLKSLTLQTGSFWLDSTGSLADGNLISASVSQWQWHCPAWDLQRVQVYVFIHSNNVKHTGMLLYGDNTHQNPQFQHAKLALLLILYPAQQLADSETALGSTCVSFHFQSQLYSHRIVMLQVLISTHVPLLPLGVLC